MEGTVKRSIQTSDKVKIVYDYHKVSSTCLVFLHGIGGDHLAWTHERERLHQLGYSTLAIDQRGHGASDHPEAEAAYALDRFAQDVEEILGRERITQSILVGHSFGGAVTVKFHHLFPDTAQAYVLVDATDRAPATLTTILDHGWARALIDQLLAHQARRHAQQTIAMDDGYAGTGDWYLPRIAHDIQITGLASWLATYETLSQFDGRAVLRTMKKPVLVLEGTDDSIFPPDTALRLERELPEATLSLIPGQNHVVVLSDPRDIVQAIDRFASSLKA